MDINSTTEIINNVSEVTEEIETSEPFVVEEMVFIEESNSSINEILINEEVLMIEEHNDSLLTPLVENVELNKSIAEKNTSTKVEVETPNLSVERGDPRKGKNIFKYVLKEDCNMTAFQFAEKHSQEEWIEILEENKIKETIFQSCPNVEHYYQERWTDDLYQFFYEASNEDEIPEC
jgi:hypothetical protein